MRLDADRWRARGFETVNLTYRACAQSAGDVLWFYDRARAWFGPEAKLCAHGISAGGHLSLLIGTYRPDLYCAVSQAGPTDLTRIQDQGVYNPATGLYDSTVGSRLVHNLGAAAFGEENLAPYSPAAQASAALKNTRVLQGFSGDDPLVPFRQALDLGVAMTTANPTAYVDNLQLAIGTIPFGHGRVTQAALDDYYAGSDASSPPSRPRRSRSNGADPSSRGSGPRGGDERRRPAAHVDDVRLAIGATPVGRGRVKRPALDGPPRPREAPRRPDQRPDGGAGRGLTRVCSTPLGAELPYFRFLVAKMPAVCSPGGRDRMQRVLVHRPMKATLAAAIALLSVAAFASSAAANVPARITKTMPVRVPALGDKPNGTLTTTVVYSDTAATATASTGDTISLGSGFHFRLRTCIAYHLEAVPPTSRCAERSVDTSTNIGSVLTSAPRLMLSGQARPTTDDWGYFTAYTEVLYESGGSWLMSAHSWPDDGLQGAGIAVAAQDETIGMLPPDSTVTLDEPFDSAVNSAEPDGICAANPAPSDGSPIPIGVSTSHPAFIGAPGYYEVGLPTGGFEGQAPRGVMLVIHGGGWMKTGMGAVEYVRGDAERWRARGWETVNLTYRACGQSLDDALWFYDQARAWFGPEAKICALGTSAGGYLSLLIGANRPDLYCAVNQAGPTDLRSIDDELAYDPVTGLHDQTQGGRFVYNLAAAAFGEENLARFSPAALASGTLNTTRVLQGFSADDPLVSFQQVADLANAMRAANHAAYVDELQLAAGNIPFGHGRVTQDALNDYYAREERLVAPVTSPTVALDKR